METLRIEIQNEQEKKVIVAFLDSLNYEYKIEKDDVKMSEQINELDRRKADFLSGRATSLPWSESQ